MNGWSACATERSGVLDRDPSFGAADAVPILGEYRPVDLEPVDIDELIAGVRARPPVRNPKARAKGGAPNVLRTLRACQSVAVRRGLLSVSAGAGGGAGAARAASRSRRRRGDTGRERGDDGSDAGASADRDPVGGVVARCGGGGAGDAARRPRPARRCRPCVAAGAAAGELRGHRPTAGAPAERDRALANRLAAALG